MKIVNVNGWNLYFHPLFAKDYIALQAKASKIKEKLPFEEYISHTDVKLYTSLFDIINNIIPNDPFANYFVLKDELKRYSRVKHKGLPERYRLFFKVFKSRSSIVILWLGYPRKEGAKNDCYNVFKKMVGQGKMPDDFDDLMAMVAITEEFDVSPPVLAPPSLD